MHTDCGADSDIHNNVEAVTTDSNADFVFAKALENKDIYLAGLSYMFICLPIIWLVCEKVAEIKISKIKIICYIIGRNLTTDEFAERDLPAC